MAKPRNWLAVHAHNRRAWTQSSGKAAESRQACRRQTLLEEDLSDLDEDEPSQNDPEEDQD